MNTPSFSFGAIMTLALAVLLSGCTGLGANSDCPSGQSVAAGAGAGLKAVDLGSAADFAILAKTGISTTGTTHIVGDIGVSPITSTAITGFALVMDSSNQFSKSSLVDGKVYAADYAVPTPAKMTQAVSDMETAYVDAALRANPTATELGAGSLSAQTVAPGLYKWSTPVTVGNGLVLSGGSHDVWIFQIAQTLTVTSAAHMELKGGAKAENVFWQVGGQATLGSTSELQGTILSKTAIVLATGAKLDGLALAQTAVTLDANQVKASGASSVSCPNGTAGLNPGSNGTSGTNGPGSNGTGPGNGGIGMLPYSCTVLVGTVLVTWEGSPVGNLGYCSYVVLTSPAMLIDATNPPGCTTLVDPNPDANLLDMTDGQPAKIGEIYAAGNELGMRCTLIDNILGGTGTINILA